METARRKEHLYIGTNVLCLHDVENNTARENFEIIRELNEKNEELESRLTKRNTKSTKEPSENIYTKNFIVFAYEGYYPNGGAKDIQGEFATKEEAINLIKELFISEPSYGKPQYEHYQIYSKSMGAVVYERYFDKYQ